MQVLYAWFVSCEFVKRFCMPEQFIDDRRKEAIAVAVMDLFSRRIIGWSRQSRIIRELALDGLLMAVWRRKPKGKVLIHSNQGSQYTSEDWMLFLKAHNLEPSMSRRGNCHDNAVVESFFQLLKRERIKRKIYNNRDEAKQDIFDYIELFYNSKRRHNSNNLLSPINYENQFNVFI
nr:IS3 family transposase [Methylotenera sp. G11]